MSSWDSAYNELKSALEKLGWTCLKNESNGLEDYYSQGIVYSNFIKKGQAIHIEYGDKNDLLA